MKRWVCTVLCAAMALTLGACNTGQGPASETTASPEQTPTASLCLSVGDRYDFAAMGYRIEKLDGTAVFALDDTICATCAGEDVVVVHDQVTLEQTAFRVTVYADAQSLGDRFPLDRGMFAGKKVIAFGDSITDGCLLDPNKENGLNYEDTYFAKLCKYLQVDSDPTDLENCNFACGGTTLTYGTNGGYGISGVQRVDATAPFTDGGRVRDPYPNILQADLCVIFYGTNDLTAGVCADSDTDSSLTDTPQSAQEALTIRGGLYYMICKLRQLNPNIKILVLPPLYRRADGRLLTYSADKTDVQNANTGASLIAYRDALAAVCREQGAKMIDWYAVFDHDNFGQIGATEYSYDGLHPNVAGHEKMFQYLVE